MGKRLLLLAALLSTGYTLLGQGNTVTPYSAFGLGELYLPAYPKNLGMGGVGIATFERASLNRVNPASYADLITTTIDVGGFYRTATLATDASESSFRSGNLTNMHVGFRGAKGPTLAFGLAPYSSARFTVREVNETFNLQSISDGTGGINEFFLGAGYSFLRGRLGIGANVGLLFGNNSILFQTGNYLTPSGQEINDESDLASFPTITRDDRIRGFTYKLGLQYVDTLKKNTVGKIGLTFSGGNTLSLNTQTAYSVGFFDQGVGNLFSSLGQIILFDADTFNTIITQQRDGVVGDTTILLEDLPEATLRLPVEVGFGVGFQKLGSHAVYADVVYQAWSNFTRDGVNAGLEDAYRVALGGEWTPDLQGRSAFARWTYRAGVRYEKTYLQLNDTDILAYAGSVGIGIPIRRSLSRLNVAFEYGIRGTKSNGLIQENYFQFALGINFAERWFVRRKFN